MELKDYKDAHYRLWDWLANNPGKRKDEWPGWDATTTLSGIFRDRRIDNRCFMCDWYISRNHGGCEACAITRKHGYACYDDPVGDRDAANGLYAQWCYAMGENGAEADYEEACRIAAEIRDSWE